MIQEVLKQRGKVMNFDAKCAKCGNELEYMEDCECWFDEEKNK
jgi:hypothetical protein